jgi:hypothetical protein
MERLTPGDFKVVRQKLAFRPPEKLTPAACLDALECEVSSKLNTGAAKIGFDR